jgi:hypothetical protein
VLGEVQMGKEGFDYDRRETQKINILKKMIYQNRLGSWHVIHVVKSSGVDDEFSSGAFVVF